MIPNLDLILGIYHMVSNHVVTIKQIPVKFREVRSKEVECEKTFLIPVGVDEASKGENENKDSKQNDGLAKASGLETSHIPKATMGIEQRKIEIWGRRDAAMFG